MNVLFVNYGDFTTNSLNHIAGFAKALGGAGHACIVAVPDGKSTLEVVPNPAFAAATHAEMLANPGAFPDGRTADIVHAWTPRECVRRFVLDYQRLAHARLIIHLEDNEEFLAQTWFGVDAGALAELSEDRIAEKAAAGLSHPRRHRPFLWTADALTAIVDSLRTFAPAGIPCEVLAPPVDFELYAPKEADPKLARELGIKEGERITVFTGSDTFANESEVRKLYEAVALLNGKGIRIRLVRTGVSTPSFLEGLPREQREPVINLGFVEKARLPALLALADVLVQPGSPGPFNDFRLPSKVPEYLASGRPVVLPAANVGAELRDGVDAILLRNGSAAEIAAACERILGDPALAAALGKNGAAFARRHFSADASGRKLAALYRRVLEAPPRAGSAAEIEGEQTEVTLALRRLASQKGEPVAAAIAADLAPLVGDLEKRNPASAERRRLERESAEWKRNFELSRQHGDNLAESLEAARTESARSAGQLKLSLQHSTNLEATIEAARIEKAAADEQLALSRQHSQNLEARAAEIEGQLAAARSRIGALDGRNAMGGRLLAAARRQVAAIDVELTEATSRIERLGENLRLARQHAANLENLSGSLQRRIRELDEQCAHLTRVIHSRDETIAVLRQAEARLAWVLQSASWRWTMPIRFLRRTFIDPLTHRRPSKATQSGATADFDAKAAADNTAGGEVPEIEQPPAFAISHCVDNPQSLKLPPRPTLFRGWMFADDGRPITGVRAVLAGRVVEGRYGLKRADVAATMPGIPAAENSGWDIEVELSESDSSIELQARDESGGWHRFHTAPMNVSRDFEAAADSYGEWVVAYDRHTAGALAALQDQAEALAFKPLISVLMPVYNTPERWLRRAIESVRSQTYPHWELCIADDASTEPHVRAVLEEAECEDHRVKVAFRTRNGHISEASNSALALAAGEFTALLDHDDELAPHALGEVAAAINAKPGADYLYSDHDKIDEDGRRHDPYFKPGFLPDLFTAQNYTSHLSVYRTSLLREVGGFRAGFEGSQDWDLALRVVERSGPDRIVHIPRILYHWRAIRGSTALLLSEKSYPVDAARRALANHFERIGSKVDILPVPGGHWRIRHPLPGEAPLVSLIIPTRNSLPFLRRCVDSILEKTTYPRFEILVVDNGSDDPGALAYLASLSQGTHPLLRPFHSVRVIRDEAPFNFSRINNSAVRQARGEVVGLINNDIEVITPGWLEEMASQAMRPGIGCVGAMLYYPNDLIQHAGCVLGIGGVAGHAFKAHPRGAEGKFNRARLVQNYSAVTAACLVVRKAIYEQVGGFDESGLTVSFNDIDFCLKVRSAGYLNLWTPFAELYHHESASRGLEDTPEKFARHRREVEIMVGRWNGELTSDPAYNPNLTLEHEDFSLASPPRLETMAQTEPAAAR